MRGDGIRFGWRTLVGVLLLGTLLLHGFDPSFAVDGYTMGILGLLLVLALAGELESARVAGVGIRFRRLTLQRIESDLDDLPPPDESDGPGNGEEGPDDGDEGGGGSDLRPHRPPREELRAIAQAEPTAAVLSFFSEVEQAIEGLYMPLRVKADDIPSVYRQVDVLARYGVIPASEARIVLDLVGLRDAYVHGRGVDPEEAMRVVAVGARLLPTLQRARRRLGRAFEERVGQVLESIPGLAFSREPILPSDRRSPPRPDFLVTSPVRFAIEAIVATHSASLLDRGHWIDHQYRDFERGELVVVVPVDAQKFVGRTRDKSRHYWVSIEELRDWVNDRIAP